MNITFKKRPKNAILIEGFPGFGLVGNIVSEFLLENLSFERIAVFDSEDLPATAAIHKGEIIHPISLFYCKEHKLLLLHSLLNMKGFEWKIAAMVEKIVRDLAVKEVISIEGVTGTDDEKLYCFNNKKFEKLGAEPISESVVLGVTAALLLKIEKISCVFAQTHTDMPDSRAAGRVIEFLAKYLKLEIDTKPLLFQAEIFEGKVKGLMKSTEKTQIEAKRKQLSYLG